MGENPEYVFETGSPDVEIAEQLGTEIPSDFDVNATGSGAPIDLGKPYLIVRFHPVWNESKENTIQHTKDLLQAVHGTGQQVLWFWPNDDTGGEAISQTLRSFNDTTSGHSIRFMRDLPPTIFLPVLKQAACLVGNSSAGIKECSFYGTPVVDIGSRQSARLQASNVRATGYEPESLRTAIDAQIAIGRYEAHDLYRKEGTARTIAEIAATAPLYTQKTFHG